MSQSRNIVITVALLVLIALSVMSFAMYQQWRASHGELGNNGAAAPEVDADNVYLYDSPRDIRPFSLINEQGEEVDNRFLQGQWTIAFVGFTSCPDICPTTMATLSRTAERLPDRVTEPRFLMISADPETDTPDVLNRYVTFFGDDFRGLTGDRETLKALAKDLNATFSRTPGSDNAGQVQHSSHIALISPGGDFVGMIRPPLDVDTIIRTYEKLQQWRPSASS
ncbi:protein SCO1/2 [Halospina denitrificans]|uniref:Protein SCO1/2 n=1 Tax=Halospina denitrificans TaxID=332522 RepID=A0A4R7JZX8_9GAMM|nr:SCO family protein [Halospina denitrificans]TDT44110.1 protein SCO1/2 [Halospina denitrificans]